MEDTQDPKKKYLHGDLLTTVDHFVAGFKPVDQRDEYLQGKANERKAALEAEERNKRSRGKTTGPGI